MPNLSKSSVVFATACVCCHAYNEYGMYPCLYLRKKKILKTPSNIPVVMLGDLAFTARESTRVMELTHPTAAFVIRQTHYTTLSNIQNVALAANLDC